MVSGGGFIVTIVTLLFSYDSRVIFGVLNLIGACALLLIPLKKYFEKIPALTGCILMLIFCVGVNLVWEKKFKVANMLPAIVVAVIWAFF